MNKVGKQHSSIVSKPTFGIRVPQLKSRQQLFSYLSLWWFLVRSNNLGGFSGRLNECRKCMFKCFIITLPHLLLRYCCWYLQHLFVIFSLEWKKVLWAGLVLLRFVYYIIYKKWSFFKVSNYLRRGSFILLNLNGKAGRRGLVGLFIK